MFDVKDLDIHYPPWHYMINWHNQETDWIPSDGIEQFEQHIKDPIKVKYLQNKNWIEPGSFTYKINSNGFRTKELVKNCNSIVGLGCSHTAGIGLPQENVWIEKVAASVNLDCINLGVSGAAMDTIFRIANYWLPIITPKYVVLLCPPFARFEIRQSKKDMGVFLPEMEQWSTPEQKIIMKNWWINDENIHFNTAKNLLGIQKICDNIGTKLYVYQGSEIVTFTDDYARDFIHYGPKAHDEFSKKVIKDIQGSSYE